jgi:hypothetical protein
VVVVDDLLVVGQRFRVSAVRHGDRRSGRLVGGIGVSGDAELAQRGRDAVLTGGAHVVDGAGQGWRDPEQPAAGVGQDLHVHPVALVFAAVERPVLGDAVDRDEGAVQDQVQQPGCPIDGLVESGCLGGQ